MFMERKLNTPLLLPPNKISFLCTENTTKIMNKYYKNDFYCIELLQKRLYYILIFQYS